MGVFQSIKAMFLVTFFLLLCGTLWLGYKFVTAPAEVVGVAAAQMPTPEQLAQASQRQHGLPPGQQAMQKSVDKMFTEVSHQMDEVGSSAEPDQEHYSQATDEDYSDFGAPSVEVGR